MIPLHEIELFLVEKSFLQSNQCLCCRSQRPWSTQFLYPILECLIHFRNIERQPSEDEFCFPHVDAQFGVEELYSWKGQIKSGGSLLLPSKVPLWVCFYVRRLRWELNPELWQGYWCSPTWTHAEWHPSARTGLMPHIDIQLCQPPQSQTQAQVGYWQYNAYTYICLCWYMVFLYLTALHWEL